MSRLVYSTDRGQLCPECHQAIDACRCKEIAEQQRLNNSDGIVRIRRETKGRKGKGVTIVSGLPLTGEELKKLAKELKQKLSTGGAIKDGELEFQGDVRQALKPLLEGKSYTVKISGG
ncbi:stress response translation initiation inhibitor YciH [Spongiibacter sp. KMU-158]|uniref:Stress response translation initiation inhibitor YciH n=1 Tax=Spongiibacter pelagi TaxID=2760804 RepID=A0A927BYZ1_9GAMM|nr:stress response translation initiation inhibitor YciH [Spongiibacter pelagi]MBD2858164.1 stress response translation initiation inhibitor YciH [Spongiibacter pelagi]